MIRVSIPASAGAPERELIERAARIVDLMSESLLTVEDAWVRAWLPLTVCHLIAANVAAGTKLDSDYTDRELATGMEMMLDEVRQGWQHGVEAAETDAALAVVGRRWHRHLKE